MPLPQQHRRRCGLGEIERRHAGAVLLRPSVDHALIVDGPDGGAVEDGREGQVRSGRGGGEARRRCPARAQPAKAAPARLSHRPAQLLIATGGAEDRSAAAAIGRERRRRVGDEAAVAGVINGNVCFMGLLFCGRLICAI